MLGGRGRVEGGGDPTYLHAFFLMKWNDSNIYSCIESLVKLWQLFLKSSEVIIEDMSLSSNCKKAQLKSINVNVANTVHNKFYLRQLVS